jgi:hypothetical protein
MNPDRSRFNITLTRMAIVCFVGLAITAAQGASTINATNEYAWGANIGWTNWRPDFDGSNMEGVVVGEFICSGYVYGANVGWINLGNGNPPNHIQYQNNSAMDFGVNYTADSAQPGIAILRGFAYAANIGWINFEVSGNPRLSLFTGTFSGYAYSANCGWINLNDSLGRIQTNQLAMGADSNANGVADAWEYLYFGGLLAPGAENSDPNGNGMTLLDDYRDGVNPLLPNSGLRITAFSTSTSGPSQTSAMTWISTTARLYTIEVNTDLTQPLNWADSGLGLFAPDAGTSTTRNVLLAPTSKRFFRVKTMRPLP